MLISHKVTNGLAWAGVLVVVGVLSADFVTSRFAPGTSEMVMQTRQPDVFPLPLSARPKAQVVASVDKPAAVTKPAAAVAKPVQTASSVAVDDFLATGKPMPSYITGAAPQAAVAPAKPVAPAQAAAVQTAAVAPAAPAEDPIVVSSIEPHKIAPVPMPLSMRPKPQVAEPALIIDETTTASIQKPRINAPVPTVNVPEPTADVPAPPADIVSADELQDWETGPLSDFLARKNGTQSSAQYDADGFYLGDGPNAQPRRPRGDRNLGPASSAQYDFYGN